MNILAKLAAAVLAAALFLPGQAAAQTMTQADVDSIVGQAIFHTAGPIGPSTSERSNVRVFFGDLLTASPTL